MQDAFGEVGGIELSHAIRTLLGGTEDKENQPGQTLYTAAAASGSYLEGSSINKTPHDGTLDRSSARRYCRRLQGGEDATPKKRREPRRHLNSVNILCRSKRRKLSERQAATDEMGYRDELSDLDSLMDWKKYGPLKTLQYSNVQVVDRNGAPTTTSATDAGVMVKDSTGRLHAAEFVPVLVDESSGGYVLSEVKREGESSQEGVTQQDESLTNITWLKKMSAPGVESGDSAQLLPSDADCERPPYSYSALIQFALISTNVGKMTLKEIYDWIQLNFPFFKTAKLGWKNSIRHNLSLHKIFIREPPDGPGQPAYWTLRSGTVVRLPENRLFVMDCMGSDGSRSRRPKACIKQADGTTQMISENYIPPPPKPKPILPRIPPGYALVSMPMVSGLSSNTLTTSYRSKKGRYHKIAPKGVPEDRPTPLCLPTTSLDARPIDDVGTCSFGMPQQHVSHGQPGPSTESDGPTSMIDDSTPSYGGPPAMSTPLKQTVTTPSRVLTDSMDPITPSRGSDPVQLSDLTPIRGTGMTPIIKEFLSHSPELQVTPVRRPRRPDGDLVSTPVVVADPNELSFDLEELFGTDLNVPSTTEGSPNHYSFSHLFSPISRT